jgi:hypothetical protein
MCRGLKSVGSCAAGCHAAVHQHFTTLHSHWPHNYFSAAFPSPLTPALIPPRTCLPRCWDPWTHELRCTWMRFQGHAVCATARSVIYCGHFSLGPASCYHYDRHLSALPTRQRGLRGLAWACVRPAPPSNYGFKGYLRPPYLFWKCLLNLTPDSPAQQACACSLGLALNFPRPQATRVTQGRFALGSAASRFQMSVSKPSIPGLILTITDKDLPPIRYAGRLIRRGRRRDSSASAFALICQSSMHMKIDTRVHT